MFQNILENPETKRIHALMLLPSFLSQDAMHLAYGNAGVKSVGRTRALACYFVCFCQMVSKQKTAKEKPFSFAAFCQNQEGGNRLPLSWCLDDVFFSNLIYNDLDKLLIFRTTFLCVQIRPVYACKRFGVCA